MKHPLCPRCGSDKLILISDGVYRCTRCGYAGSLEGKEIVKS